MSEDAYARREGFPTKIVMVVLAGIVVVLWFTLGHSYLDAPLQDVTPPTVWLVYEGNLYTGIRGSYCWANKCVEARFPELLGIIQIPQGSSIWFLMNSWIEPTTVYVPVYIIDGSGNQVQVGELLKRDDGTYTIELEEGVYILQLHAYWDNVGDVNYAFRISVN